MGVVSDFIDGIKDWFNDTIHDVLEGGITSNFENISDVLTSTYTSATEDDGLMSIFLTSHPARFTGTTTISSVPVWATIERLCNNVVVPIAGFILTVILLSDLIQTVMRGNNFKEIDDSIFIKWIIKSVCGILLVSNTYYIASGLFSFGTNVCANGLSYLISGNLKSISITEFKAALSNYDNGEMLMMLCISFVILIAIMLLTVAIVIVLASRMIEIFMYLGVSPIPMATMLNNEWGQVGKNWIKGVIALSFQGFFIIIALGIFKTIFNNVIVSITNVEDGVIMSMLMLAGYSAALIYTVLRSGQISKSIFNAT